MSNEKYIRVACRLCGKIMLFPKPFYKESDFKGGWECKGSLSKTCKIVAERERRSQ